MPPTTTSPTGGNHTFKIIEPEVASEARVAAGVVPTSSPTPRMPYSSCSGANGCHTRSKGPDGTYDRYGLYLQDTIEQRQEWTKAKIAETWTTLDKAAKHLGYADTEAAHTALVAVPAAEWTTAERAFLSSFTNNEFVESEGSFGLHNWDYSREIVNAAIMQAKIAESGVIVKLPWTVKLSLSKSSVKANTKVKFSGSVTTARGVVGAGTVKIMKRVGGVWKVWQRTKLKSSGKYSLTVKMTKKGKFYFRALMPADSLNKAANSGQRKLVVK
jgi:hypothetical protein